MIVGLKKQQSDTILHTNTSTNTNTFIYNALLIKTASMFREVVKNWSYSFENNNYIFFLIIHQHVFIRVDIGILNKKRSVNFTTS